MTAEKDSDDRNGGSFFVEGWNCRQRDDLLLFFAVFRCLERTEVECLLRD